MAIPRLQGYELVAAQPLQFANGAVALPVPPTRDFLQTILAGAKKIACSLTGRKVGSFTVKSVAGILIGAGIICGATGGVGLPLLIAGAVLFLISTSFSVTALDDKSAFAVTCHLAGSAVAAALGIPAAYVCYLGTLIANALAPILSGVVAGIILSPVAIVDFYNMDYRDNLLNHTHGRPVVIPA